ncbi:MAG: signal peptidase II [Spirochaetaceae bacterium]|jgi:signal peptidase II|nr:signal peptidase II [Spirochaetaceae bacterium]
MNKNRWLPFVLAFSIVLLDQITKAWIVKLIPAYDWSSFINVIGSDFLRFIHVKNLGVALSIGQDSSVVMRLIFFKIFPLIVMGYLGYLIYNWEKEGFTKLQIWMLALILGGGIGNLIDRIFRPDGVVDWVDVKFYGIFGWERFPTFNVADAAISIGAVVIFITFVISVINKKKTQKEDES